MVDKKLTWKDATQFGLSPDDRCDWCRGKFYQEPIKDQNLAGRNKLYCSQGCFEMAQVLRNEATQ